MALIILYILYFNCVEIEIQKLSKGPFKVLGTPDILDSSYTYLR